MCSESSSSVRPTGSDSGYEPLSEGELEEMEGELSLVQRFPVQAREVLRERSTGPQPRRKRGSFAQVRV